MTFARRPGPVGRFNRRGLGSSGGWRPTMFSGCVLWLRADMGITKDGSDRVSAWADQSGTGDANKHMAQATGGFQPLWVASSSSLGGKNALRLDKARSDHMVSGTWAAALATHATWFAACTLTATDSAGGSMLSGEGHILYQQSSKWTAYAGTNLTQPDTTAPPRTLITAAVLGTSGKLFINARTAVATGTTGTTSLTRLLLGTNAVGGGTWDWTGDVAEIGAFNRALTQAEVEAVLGYMGSRYAVSIGA